ncbi:MAG: hypothetical protein RLZZ528_402 [Pseudomonadota bacterium]|jgi:2-haloacid dehalogenase
MSVDAVVFDLGNVLVEWNPEAYYDARIGPEARRRMFEETDIHAVNIAIDAGAPYRDSIYALADRYPHWADEVRRWYDDQFGMLTPVLHHTIRLRDALRGRGVPVFALSNWGDESFDRAYEAFPFFRDFDRHYISGKLGMIKPEPAIYAHVEADSGIEPGGLFFIDDRIDNIRAAEARGWQVHHFAGPGGLASRLVEMGLLTGEEAQ